MERQRAKEEKAKKERLNEFKKLIHVAYQLFDGKYSIDTIEKMPYHLLLDEMDREQKEIEKNAETRANKKMTSEMKKMGL